MSVIISKEIKDELESQYCEYIHLNQMDIDMCMQILKIKKIINLIDLSIQKNGFDSREFLDLKKEMHLSYVTMAEKIREIDEKKKQIIKVINECELLIGAKELSPLSSVDSYDSEDEFFDAKEFL